MDLIKQEICEMFSDYSTTIPENATHHWSDPTKKDPGFFFNFRQDQMLDEDSETGLAVFYQYYLEKLSQEQSIVNLSFSEIVSSISRPMSFDFKLVISPQSEPIADASQVLDVATLTRMVATIRNYIDTNFYHQNNNIHEDALVAYSDIWEEVCEFNQSVLVPCVYLRINFYHMRIQTSNYKVYLREVIDLLNRITFRYPLLKPLDQSVIDSDKILMFGSSNQLCRSPLKYVFYWQDSGLKPYLNQEQVSNLVPEHHNDIREGYFDLEPGTYSNRSLFAFYFSLGYPPDEIMVKNSEVNRVNDRLNDNNHIINDESDYEQCLRFIAMLKPERFLKHETNWYDIGRALYNTTEGKEEGLKSWIEVTNQVMSRVKTARPYFMAPTMEQAARRLYETFHKSLITHKTIAFYAAQDNPEEYNRWHQIWFSMALYESVEGNGNQADVAKAFYRRYWLNYLFRPGSHKGKWYKFRNHRWHEILQGISGLRDVISHHFPLEYIRLITKLNEQLASLDDEQESERKAINNKLKILQNIVRDKLKGSNYKDGMMKELSCCFAHEKFEYCHDENYYMTACRNCVLEIVDDRVITRDGKPEDFLTMAMDVSYHAEYTNETPIVAELLDWLSKVFPSRPVREFFLKIMASLLVGRNLKKKFFVFTGCGNNSKSMIVRLMEEVLGSFCCKLPVKALTDTERSSSGPSPEMAQTQGCRAAITEEPESNVILKSSKIKQMTGNDKQFYRFLNENGRTFVQTYKSILCCNNPPRASDRDRAMELRMCVLPFISIWVENPPASEEEQRKTNTFKDDKNFENRIPLMAPAMLWLMVRYYPEFVKNFDYPEEIRVKCQEYWKNSDFYSMYVEENIALRDINVQWPTDAKLVSLKWSEVYNNFKAWYAYNFPGTKVPNAGTVKGNIVRYLGEILGNSGWIGHQFKNPVENKPEAQRNMICY